MTMTDPLLYRLWCLRRLIVLAILLPCASLMILWFATKGSAAATRPDIAIPVLAGTILFFVTHVLRHPRAGDETLALSLSIAALLLVTPVCELLVSFHDGPLGTEGYIGLVILLFLAWFTLLVGSAWLVNWLICKARRRRYVCSLVFNTGLSPKAAHDALRPRPNETSIFGRTGPVARNGSFPVWPDLKLPPSLSPAPATGGPWGDSPAPGYWLTVTDVGQTGFGAVAVLANGTISTSHYLIEPTASGARISKTETTDALSWCGAMLFYLIDADRDHLIAHLDEATRKGPPRAIQLQPYRSLFFGIANALPNEDLL
jgi:hypothetical protein